MFLLFLLNQQYTKNWLRGTMNLEKHVQQLLALRYGFLTFLKSDFSFFVLGFCYMATILKIFFIIVKKWGLGV